MLSLDIGEKPVPVLALIGGEAAPAIPDRPVEVDPIAETKRLLESLSDDTVRLVLAGDFDQAERRVREIDRDAMGAHALAAAYEAALRSDPANPRLLERALYWVRSGFPDLHTAHEAEAFGAAIREGEARLRQIYRGP
ncbi:MAG: hypothetical protein R3C13_08755 [Hyphomonas sp.]|uniref:hypothetical protein n=1 Tax=Hyphomonas sp. TaxID=87 RepID=UPI003527F7EA